MNTVNDIHQNRPPRVESTDDEDAIYSDTTGAAAGSADIWTGYAAGVPDGKCWLELEAVTTVAYVRFSRTATTATTSSNGTVLALGVPRRFYVDPTKDLYLDHIATGAGVIKWRRVGHICERSRQ